MSHDDDLSDTAFESIYGAEALGARQRARTNARWQRIQAQQDDLECQLQAMRERLDRGNQLDRGNGH